MLLSFLIVSGCGGEGNERLPAAASCCTVQPGTGRDGEGQAHTIRSFPARGVLDGLPDGGNSALVRHDEIPGFMPAMTMEFKVRDSDELRNLQSGDGITFDLKVTEAESWIENVRRVTFSVIDAKSSPDPAAASLLDAGRLKPGDVLPDAELLSEEGRTIRFSDFKGQALAFTFIFTRCPLPDYCPRLSQHFNQTREQLRRRPDGPTNWTLLSISFDAGFDRPDVLKRYAEGYRHGTPEQWVFASAPPEVMSALASQLDFRFSNDGGSFAHNMRTIVVDGRRRIHRRFDGSEWKPEELAEALLEAAGSG